MKIAIVGSRKYKNLNIVKSFVENLIGYKDLIIISGGADGVDKTAEEVSMENQIKTIIYRIASWYKNGKYNPSAGFERNTTIVENSEIVFCFWDGTSNGCLDTIKKAKNLNKSYFILDEEGNLIKKTVFDPNHEKFYNEITNVQ